jgi:hypothetical protein
MIQQKKIRDQAHTISFRLSLWQTANLFYQHSDLLEALEWGMDPIIISLSQKSVSMMPLKNELHRYLVQGSMNQKPR